MTARERIHFIKILEGSNKYPEFFKEIKVEAFMKKENSKKQDSKDVEDMKSSTCKGVRIC